MRFFRQTALLLLFTGWFPSSLFAQSEQGGIPTYSPGGWPTLHQDAGNRRAVPVSVTDGPYQAWHALAGASVLTAPVTSPDGRQIYVTTGMTQGNSNLHAFTITGKSLWQSAPWSGPDDGVDPCALLSSPIVDRQGTIYLGDCNQVFAFTDQGTIKWQTALPLPKDADWKPVPDHPVNAFTTAAFTQNGHLLGVTNFGDVIIIDRETGAVLNAPYRLPTALAPYAETVPMPDSLLAHDLMDPAFREWTWQLIFGGSMRSANTPAIGTNNRVFVVGSSMTPGLGSLFGLDIDTSIEPFKISAAFVTDIGKGSGSSPALSPSENQVYVSDEEGWLYGIDSTSGDIQWKVKTTAAAGAAAVGPDGTVYALQSSGPSVVAITPDGSVAWQSDIRELDSGLPDSWLLGAAVGSANGNPVVTREAVLVPIMFGYELPFVPFNAPVSSQLVALDIGTGIARSTLVQLADDSSGITAVLPDGTLINSLGAVMTSALLPAAPILNWLLPDDIVMLEPHGGIQVSAPDAASMPAP